ncbi:MAG: hypothetical protein FWB77_02085 [Treponema sp.]|nr:hypothetical protein [Treponema sp.]
MRRLYFLVIVIIISTVSLFAQDLPRLAILPFTGGTQEEAETIAEFFSYNRDVSKIFTIIPRTSATLSVMMERQFQRENMIDPDTIIDLGRRVLNADYVLAGHITSLGSGVNTKKLLLVSIMHINELRQVAGDYRQYTRIEDTINLIPQMANKITGNINIKQNQVKLNRLSVPRINVQSSGINQEDAEVLAQILATDIVNTGRFAVYPRTVSLERVQQEYSNQNKDINNPANIRRIGVSTEYVLSVNARIIGEHKYFSASIIKLNDGSQQQGTQKRYQNVEDGFRLMNVLAIELTETDKERQEREQVQKQQEVKNRWNREQQRKARERTMAWDNFWNDERRFNSVGVNVGSFYGVPALAGIVGGLFSFGGIDDGGFFSILGGTSLMFLGALPLTFGVIYETFSPIVSGNFNITIAPIPYTFIEFGCDALFFNPNGAEGDKYLSFYPYANFCGFIGEDGFEEGGFFFGVGVGRMFTIIGAPQRINFPDLIHDRFAFNVIIGGKIGTKPHYLDIRAIGSFDFNDGFYYTILCGYSFRFVK